jgi:hypothetical protein
MTEKELEMFAIYSYDQESRGVSELELPSYASNSSNISMFGVGSKQAGFYLGNRMHVISKSALQESVLEMVLDEEIMQQRDSRGETVSNISPSLAYI